MIPNHHYTAVPGANLSWFEWGADYAGKGTILLVHATGFHARCWDQVVGYLGQRHVIAVDQRGHGLSTDDGPFTWDQFGADLAAFVQQLEVTNVTGVGHSMGGHALVQAAAVCKDVFSQLVLIDPVIMSPSTYQTTNVHLAWMNDDGEHPVARRKNHFTSPAAFHANLAGRGSYALWQPECLKDYCEHGVVQEGDHFRLSCPPKVEAAIYLGSSSSPIFDSVAAIDIPVTVLRAKLPEPERKEMDFSSSPTWVELAGQFRDAVDIPLPDLTHFIPMQAPELTARYILKPR